MFLQLHCKPLVTSNGWESVQIHTLYVSKNRCNLLVTNKFYRRTLSNMRGVSVICSTEWKHDEKEEIQKHCNVFRLLKELHWRLSWPYDTFKGIFWNVIKSTLWSRVRWKDWYHLHVIRLVTIFSFYSCEVYFPNCQTIALELKT